MDLSTRAKEIIAKILYITIASCTKDGTPWNSPVYSAYDENYTFYWTSTQHAQHSQNIQKNPTIALVIYDSTAPEGTGEGVYIKANASMVEDEEEINHAIKYLSGRTGHTPKAAAAFMGDSPLRLFKAVPEKFWMNGVEELHGCLVDKREEITL